MIKNKFLNLNFFIPISVGFLIFLSNLINYEKKLTVISFLFILFFVFIINKGITLPEKKFSLIESLEEHGLIIKAFNFDEHGLESWKVRNKKHE